MDLQIHKKFSLPINLKSKCYRENSRGIKSCNKNITIIHSDFLDKNLKK